MIQLKSCCVIILGIISGIICLTLFFTVLLPDIKHVYYVPTKMIVTNIEIIPRYCCYTECEDCVETEASVICSIKESYYNSIDPNTCMNSQSCPNDTMCDGGEYCCSQCCFTCETCSRKRYSNQTPSSSNPPPPKITCYTYSCNCYCCVKVQHRKCVVKCPKCYRDVLYVEFNVSGIIYNAKYEQDFEKNYEEANNFFQKYKINQTLIGYYNPSNYHDIILSRQFVAWKWIVFFPFALGLFLSLMHIFRISIHVCCFKDYDYEDLIARRWRDWFVLAFTFEIFLGIILPLVILLPIYFLGFINNIDKIILEIIVIYFPIAWLGGLSAVMCKRCVEIRRRRNSKYETIQ